MPQNTEPDRESSWNCRNERYWRWRCSCLWQPWSGPTAFGNFFAAGLGLLALGCYLSRLDQRNLAEMSRLNQRNLAEMDESPGIPLTDEDPVSDNSDGGPPGPMDESSENFYSGNGDGLAVAHRFSQIPQTNFPESSSPHVDGVVFSTNEGDMGDEYVDEDNFLYEDPDPEGLQAETPVPSEGSSVAADIPVPLPDLPISSVPSMSASHSTSDERIFCSDRWHQSGAKKGDYEELTQQNIAPINKRRKAGRNAPLEGLGVAKACLGAPLLSIAEGVEFS